MGDARRVDARGLRGVEQRGDTERLSRTSPVAGIILSNWLFSVNTVLKSQ